ncbi:hypothetical protein [Corynebacterium halotolerans]|uniref:hypothetical protein n=1 Tax=Corynebacterium halotolerans TaxID=225326 RepID=UPI003CFAF5F8
MEININSSSIDAAVAELAQLDETAQGVLENARQATLNGSYSGVSGLDQLGAGHGAVLNGGPGSAMGVLESYAEQISWLHQALIASSAALTGQNMFVSRGMDIADEGGSVGADSVFFPQRPMPRFENFSFTPPMVSPALSIDQLASDFSTTKIGASIAAGQAWQAMSTNIAGVAAGLKSVAGKLTGDNSGEVIDAAVQKISEVAQAGDTFARNSGIMAASVRQLTSIKSHGNVQVNLARTALAAIADPVQREAAEQAFLASFPASFTASVATGIPPIRNLMSIDGSVDGGGEVALGMTDVEGDGPAEVTGLSPAGSAAGAVDTARQLMTAGQFGAVNQGLGELSTVGATGSEPGGHLTADHLGTGAASLGSPATSVPALPGMGTGAGTAGGGLPGGLSGTGMPLGMVGGTRPGMAGGIGSPSSGIPGTVGLPGGLGAVGGAGGVRGPGVMPAGGGLSGSPVSPGLSPAATTTNSMPLGGMGAPLMGAAGGSQTGGQSGRGTSGFGGVGGVGGGPAGRGGGLGTAPGLGGAGSRGGVVPGGPGAAAAGSGVGPDGGPARSAAAGGRGTGAGMARGMMPMMGAPMAGAGGAQGKTGKVRTITSSVEEEGNIAALLGDRGPVVPGVIGAWARG